MTTPDSPAPANMTLQATLQRQAVQGQGSGGQGGPRQPASLSDRFAWPGRIALLVAAVLAPWAFGAYEFWAQRWLAISLLIGLAFWWFETAMNQRKSQVFPYLFFPVTAGILLALFQLVGLPEWISGWMLGQQPEIYSQFTEIAGRWPSVSVDHDGTWDHIRLLVIATGAMLLGCRYFRSKRDIGLLLTTMTINGVVMSFFGIVHKLTSNGKLYWVKELTQGGQPFGPFVNRNNAAGYLLICLACAIGLLPIVMGRRKNQGPRNLVSKEMPFWRQINYHLVEFIAELTATKMALLLAVVLIASAVIATLSRGGVIAMLIAGALTIMWYGMARQPKESSFIFIPLVASIALLTGWLSFGEALIQRFEGIDLANVSQTDLRMQHWQSTWPAVNDHGVFGSGLGSYKGIHRLYRSDSEDVVFYFAENQYFQAIIEAGIPGLILFLIAWFIAYKCATLALNRGSSNTTIAVGTMGVFLIFSQATASLVDFGLYMPANMFAVAMLSGFLAYHAQALGNRLKDQSWLRFQVPNYVIQVTVLFLFSAVCLVAVDLHQRAGIESLLRPRAALITPQTMSLKQTEDRLADLMPRVRRKPSPAALNYTAALWIHRCRLMLFDEMQSMEAYQAQLQILTEDEKSTARQNLWNLTNLQRLHENIYFLSQESRFGDIPFRNKPAIKENLPVAKQLLSYSRDSAPLQPVVHLRLAQLDAVIEKPGAGNASLERTISLAPGNPQFRLVAGIYYLQSGTPKLAGPHLKRYLELEPSKFRDVLELLTARTNRIVTPVAPSQIVNQMIPDDPQMLYAMAMEYFPAESQERKTILADAAELIVNADQRRQRNIVTLGDIRRVQGELEEAVENYSSAILSEPYDRETRYKRAQVLIELDRLDEALDDAKYLQDHGPKKRVYIDFLKQVEQLIKDRPVEFE